MSDNNTIVIIDYNMGNLRSVQKAFEHVGADVCISQNPDVIQRAAKIVLPGVGAFSDGMRNLTELGLVDVLDAEILKKRKPFLGICLGMQLISSLSHENSSTPGLGWIEGEVTRFDHSAQSISLKVPHVGWNNVSFRQEHELFQGIPDNSDFYFVHSYHFQSTPDVTSSVTNYGYDFVSSIHRENIYAFQFHPEKSQDIGLQILRNFHRLPKH